MRAIIMPVLVLFVAVALQSVSAQPLVPQWTEHLGFNVTSPPLDNLLLRQAIASAIDRQPVFQAIPQSAWSGGWRGTGPAASWFPPFVPQHDPDVRIHPYDLAIARGLMGRAGFPDGRGLPVFEILYRQDRPVGVHRQAEAESVARQLAALGIMARAVGIPTGTAFFERVVPGAGKQPQYQMAVFAWGAENRDEDMLSRTFLQGAPQNGYGYQNPEVTLLIAQIVRETEPAKRVALLRQAEKMILTDAPVVPLIYIWGR